MVPVRKRKERLIRSRRKRALGAAVVCAAVGTTLVLLSLGGVGGMFDALALVGASVAFAAAAIFLVISIVLRRSRRLAITYHAASSGSERSDVS